MSIEHRFTQRGFTRQVVPDLDYGMALIDWMADRDLNRLELRNSGGSFGWPIVKHPEVCSDDAQERTDRLKRLTEHGRERGVRVVPIVCHSDGLTAVLKAHPDWRVEGHVPHATGVDLADYVYCWRHPGVIEFYHDAVHDLVAALEPDEVQFWCTENYLRCECPRCNPDGSKDAYDLTGDFFVAQARLFHECIEPAREARPDLEMSIWTTQGSRWHNDLLIRSLPKDVLWFYYDGERRGDYNLRRIKVIPAEIRQLQEEGYRLGVQVDWYSCGSFLTTPSRVREQCAEAAEVGLEAVVGWVGGFSLNQEKERGGTHPVLGYAARMLNEPTEDEGESLVETMRDAALAAGQSEAVADAAGQAWRVLDDCARTIHLTDAYAYWWHGVNLPGAICKRIARRAPVDEIDQRWTDEAWEQTVPELDACDSRLQKEMAALEALHDGTGYLESIRGQLELVRQWGRLCRSCLWAAIVYNRVGSWDTCKGPWRDDQTELVNALRDAMSALEQVDGMMERGHRLLQGSTQPSGRLPVLKEQLAAALEAAEQGARPEPLPDDDRYPYA